MDLKCLILPGLLVAMVSITVLSSIGGRLSQQRERARQVWLNASMQGSKMARPAPVWEPGQPIVEEYVPVPDDENATSNFVSNWKARKARQREHAQAMALKRLHERSCREHARRSDVDAAIKQAYASLGKEIEE